MVAALRRFIARSIPNLNVSDNATIFVDARRDLNELENVVQVGAQSYSSIEWFFIPPRSPNFGGLWEAAVKSIKHHLRRVMGSSLPTYRVNDNTSMPNRASNEQSSLDGSHKQPRWHLCNYPVNYKQWQSMRCYPTALSAEDGCSWASSKRISRVFNSYSLNTGSYGPLNK